MVPLCGLEHLGVWPFVSRDAYFSLGRLCFLQGGPAPVASAFIVEVLLTGLASRQTRLAHPDVQRRTVRRCPGRRVVWAHRLPSVKALCSALTWRRLTTEERRQHGVEAPNLPSTDPKGAHPEVHTSPPWSRICWTYPWGLPDLSPNFIISNQSKPFS